MKQLLHEVMLQISSTISSTHMHIDQNNLCKVTKHAMIHTSTLLDRPVQKNALKCCDNLDEVVEVVNFCNLQT